MFMALRKSSALPSQSSTEDRRVFQTTLSRFTDIILFNTLAANRPPIPQSPVFSSFGSRRFFCLSGPLCSPVCRLGTHLQHPSLISYQELRYTTSCRCGSSSLAFSRSPTPQCRQTAICVSLQCRRHSYSGGLSLCRSQSGQTLFAGFDPGSAGRMSIRIGIMLIPTSGF